MKKLITLALMLTAFCGVSMADDTYYIVGTLNGIDGTTDWSFPDSHKMTKNGDVYTWTKENVTVADATTFSYKVSNAANWSGTVWGKVKDGKNSPGDNQEYTVNNTGSGVYTITFTFDPAAAEDSNDKVSCSAVRTDDIYLTWGDTADPNEGILMTNTDGIYTATQSLTTGKKVLFVPSSSWSGSGISNYSNVAYAVTGGGYYNVYFEHMEGTTEATGSYQRWYIGEDATYTFTYNSKTESFMVDAVATVSVSSAGWATYSLGSDGNNRGYTVSGADAFYVASTADGKAVLTSIASGKKIPTYPKGIMLKKIGGGSVTITTTAESDVTLTDNMLQGSGRYTNWDLDNSGYTGYYLANGASGLGFYPANTGDMSAHKAFLRVPTGSARDFFSFDEETTGIKQTTANVQQTNEYFNLAGQRVAQPTKGLYIVNGKKVIIK